jgi:hypothetical protein
MKSAIGIGIKGTSKPKRNRDLVKHVLVSPDVHAELKAYAIKNGYRTQGLADEAIAEYLKRQETK